MKKKSNEVLAIKEFYKKIVKSGTRLYLLTFTTFLLTFGFIFMSPQIFGSNYDYPDTPIAEYETVNNNVAIALVRKEFNPETQLLRLDYSMKDSGLTSSLSNMDYEVISQDIETRKAHDVEVIRVNDGYMVILVSGLKNGYTVLSNTIEPYYIHPEIEQTNDLEGKSIKSYVNESNEFINTNLKKLEENEYQSEYISFQQDELKETISLNNEQQASIEIKIKETKKQIENEESDVDYMTAEEKIDSQNKINTHLSTINQLENDLGELDEANKNAEEKINLLEERRKKYK